MHFLLCYPYTPLPQYFRDNRQLSVYTARVTGSIPGAGSGCGGHRVWRPYSQQTRASPLFSVEKSPVSCNRLVLVKLLGDMVRVTGHCKKCWNSFTTSKNQVSSRYQPRYQPAVQRKKQKYTLWYTAMYLSLQTENTTCLPQHVGEGWGSEVRIEIYH